MCTTGSRLRIPIVGWKTPKAKRLPSGSKNRTRSPKHIWSPCRNGKRCAIGWRNCGNYERYGIPTAKGDRYFFSHNDGLQNQSVLYTSDSLQGDRKVLIDPNKLSEDGTVCLGWEASRRMMAPCSRMDWPTAEAIGELGGCGDVASGKDTADVVQWVKFSSIAWMPDNSGFFYSRYSEPVEGEELTGTNENQRMYFHKLGTPQSEDQLIIDRPDHPKWGFSPTVTDDGRYLVVQNWKGTEPKEQVFVKDLRNPDSKVELLIGGFDAEYIFVASIEDVIYFLTDHEAPRRRIIAVDVTQSGREHWREVVGRVPRRYRVRELVWGNVLCGCAARRPDSDHSASARWIAHR